MSVRSAVLAAVSAAAAVLIALAPAATAAPLFNDRFHDAGSEVVDDFCGLDGVTHAWDVQGMSRAGGRGRDQLVYFLDSIHGMDSYTNPTTGKSYTHVYNVVIRDFKVTDNGDGTLTIVATGAGGDKWYAADGTFLSDAGTVRWAFIVDHAGTPANPEDDSLIEDLGVVKPSTGTNDADGRDFCTDFVTATT